MKTQKRTNLSLYACRKLIPIINAGKIISFLAALFFQQDGMLPLFVTCVFLVIMFLTTDTYLKLSVWKCPSCGHVLPNDFYSRKTMTHCPNCKEELDFSDTRFFVPISDTEYTEA